MRRIRSSEWLSRWGWRRSESRIRVRRTRMPIAVGHRIWMRWPSRLGADERCPAQCRLISRDAPAPTRGSLFVVQLAADLARGEILAVGQIAQALDQLFMQALLMTLALRVPDHIHRPRREH